MAFRYPRFTRTGTVLTLVLMFLAVPVLLLAQATISTGNIQGTITDQSDAVVNGAKVIISNKATGQVINLATSSAGAYSSGALLPGNYVVRIEQKGFKTAELAVVVSVGVPLLAILSCKLARKPRWWKSPVPWCKSTQSSPASKAY